MNRVRIGSLVLLAWLLPCLVLAQDGQLTPEGEVAIDGKPWVVYSDPGGMRVLVARPIPGYAIERLERVVSFVRAWKVIAPSEIRADFSGGEEGVDYVVIVSRVTSASKDYATHIPSGIRLRFSGTLLYELRKDFDFNAIGFAGYAPLGVYMGLRNVSTFTNTLNGLFAFSANSSINLRARHYWRWLEYSSYHNLSSDGSLSDPITNIGLSRNVSYSTFNIDLIYQWNFAPGSVLSVVWKNAVEMRGNEIDKNFADSFESLINSQQYNSFSFKVLYYLDYQSLRRRG